MKFFSRKKRKYFILTAIVIVAVILAGSFFAFKRLSHGINYNIAKEKSGGYLYKNANKDFEVDFLNRTRPNEVDVNYSYKDTGVEMQLLDEKGKPATIKNQTVKKQDGKDNIVFADVRKGTDLGYRIIDNGVKEEMILKDKSAIAGNYTFNLDLKNAEPKKAAENFYTYYFLKKGTTEYAFHLEKPFMTDAKGANPDDIAAYIRPADNAPDKYTVVLVPNKGWLTSSERAFPITVDPSVVHNTQATFDTGTYNRTESTADPKVQIKNPAGGNDTYTKLLLHADGANGTTTFLDSSMSKKPVTNNGSVPISTAQSKFGGSSAYFNGGSNYLSIPNSELNFGTADFTVDGWFKAGSQGVGYPVFFTSNTGGTYGTGSLFVSDGASSGYPSFAIGSTRVIASNASALDNAWHHMAVSRQAGVFYLFIDGVLKGSNAGYTTTACDFSASTVGFATYSPTNTSLNGYIDELRISKGIARWTDSFTPPTRAYDGVKPDGAFISPVIDSGASNTTWNKIIWTELGAQTGDGETVQNNSGLVAQWNFNEASGTNASDSTGNSHTGTLTNFASTGSQDVAPGTGWTANNKKWGAGALMFDGGNDYISVPDSNDWNFGSGDFSIESWINPITTGAQQSIISQWGGNGLKNFHLGILASNKLDFQYSTDGTNYTVLNGSKVLNAGEWYHIVVQRESANLKIYINGVLESTNSISGTLPNTTGALEIGRDPGSGSLFYKGMLDSTRIYKGRSLTSDEILSNYQAGNVELQTRTGTSSNPNDGTWEAWKPAGAGTETQLLSMDSDKDNWNPDYGDPYTKLLLHADGTNGSTTFTDSNPLPKTITSNGNAQISTAQSKFGGASAYFDGSNTFLSTPHSSDFEYGSGNFTVDFWFNASSWNTAYLYSKRANYSTYGSMAIGTQSGGLILRASSNNSSWDIANGTSLATGLNTGTWYHFALVRNGSTWTAYINGTQTATFSNASAIAANTDSVRIGGESDGYRFSGYIDEFRISKGIPRWTANFSSPSSAYASASWANQSNEANVKTEGSGSMKMAGGAAQLDSNTVGLWHMEETSGSGAYIKDSSGNANDGTPTGTAVVDGISGKGRSFNGSSDYINAGSAPPLNTTTSMTIEAWAKSTGTQGIIAAKTNAADPWNGYEMGIGGNATNGKLCYWPGNFSTYNWVCGNSTVNDGTWHHLAVVHAGTAVTFYKDGVADGSVTVGARSTNSSNDLWIGKDVIGRYFSGAIDEIRISNVARSDQEIAEAYRLGRDHRLSRTFSSTDLTNKSKLPFYVAGDRPGNYLEATVGESAYANNETDASTAGLWHLDEQSGSGAYMKDSSGNTNDGTPTGTTFTDGKIGKARSFNGSSDYIGVPYGNLSNLGNSFTLGGWVYQSAITAGPVISTLDVQNSVATMGYYLGINTSGANGMNANSIQLALGTNAWKWSEWTSPANSFTAGAWHYIAVTVDSANTSSKTVKFYIDGVAYPATYWTASTEGPVNYSTNTAANRLGSTYTVSMPSYSTSYFTGSIDEPRIDKTVRSTADIRAAYEVGKRTHPISIDFGASLDSGNLIADVNDISFTIDATTKGLQNKGDGVYAGDKIIIKENINGTEYLAQGTVNSVVASTGATTVAAWDAGSTFPAGGYTAKATVFKWQREYMDLSGIVKGTGSGDPQNQKDAATRITLRQTDGTEGRTVYLDDFESASNYLTDPAAAADNITSSAGRYLQYRTILTTTDAQITPAVSSVTVQMSGPTISSITPNTGNGADAQKNVTIAGTNLSNTTVKLSRAGQSDISCSNAIETDTQITCDLDLTNQTLGSWDVVVTNVAGGSGATLAGGFKIVDDPVVVSVAPNSGSQAGGTSVTLTGKNLLSGYEGSGADGSVTISADKNINTDIIEAGRSVADGINYSVTNIGTTSVTASGASGIVAGDEVILANLQGSSSANGNVGNYEFLSVAGVNGSTITFSSNVQKVYGAGSTNSDLTGQKIIVQRVPNYQNVTINSGKTLSANAWDGTKGGLLVFRASGTVNVQGTINMNGSGFRGGAINGYTNGNQGEGYAGAGSTGVRTSNYGGGGAGTGYYPGNTSDYGTAGGGGGYGTTGSAGGGDASYKGLAGDQYGAQELGKLYLGSGGGAGAGDPVQPGAEAAAIAGSGGNGGGIILVGANAITVSGSVLAGGANGANGVDTDPGFPVKGTGGGGGGGAGGSVAIKSYTATLGSNRVQSGGGSGGTMPAGGNNVGGTGSVGRVAAYYQVSNSGTASPSAYSAKESIGIQIDGTAVSNINVASDTSVSFNTPVHDAGTVDVKVIGLDGRTATLAHGFSYITAPSVSDPMVYYKFDDGSGTTALDSSENHQDLALVNTPAWTSDGKFGKALNFARSSSQYAWVADSSATSITSDLTISAWIKPNSNSSGTQYDIAGKWDGSDKSYLLAQYGSELRMYIGASGNYFTTSGLGLQTGQWYFVNAIYTASSRTVAVYVNGVNWTGNVTGTIPASIGDGSGRFQIGAEDSSTTPANFFDGTIDEVKIYGFALNQDQANQNYNQGDSLSMGSVGTNSDGSPNFSAAAAYCVPGSASSCSPPIGEWKFDEKTGSTVADTSTNQGTGTWYGSGSHWDRGKYGSAGKFNGTDDYVRIGTSGVDLSSGATLSAWIKPNTLGGSGTIIANSAGATNKYAITLNSATVAASYTDGSGTHKKSGTIADTNWHHVIFTWNGSSPLLYIDGVSQSGTASPTSTDTNNLVIGARSDLAGNFFMGLIDQVQIFSYAQTAAQAAWNFDQGKPVAWWKLDEGQGTKAYDSSGNNYTATMTNMDPPNDWVSGKFNGALDFDGINDYVSVPSLDLSGTNAITVSFWLNWNANSTNDSFALEFSSDYNSSTGGFTVDPNASGNKVTACLKGDVGYNCSSFNQPTAQTWHFHTYIFDKSQSGALEVVPYIDGIPVSYTKSTSSDNTNNFGSLPLYFMSRNGSTLFGAGKIDDVRIYNYVLTAAQVRTVMNDGSAVKFGN